MLIEIRSHRRVCILDCSGKLALGRDETALRREIGDRIERGDRRFVINLRDLDYLDSAGVGELVYCSKLATDHSGVMKVVVSDESTVGRVITVSGVDKGIETFNDESKAVSSFWH
ncbi:MAG: STAS domain-containing protein [bacterium]|nr:STAS domain-containing protein [bacterium]